MIVAIRITHMKKVKRKVRKGNASSHHEKPKVSILRGMFIGPVYRTINIFDGLIQTFHRNAINSDDTSDDGRFTDEINSSQFESEYDPKIESGLYRYTIAIEMNIN